MAGPGSDSTDVELLMYHLLAYKGEMCVTETLQGMEVLNTEQDVESFLGTECSSQF